jgi:hypothetical protein
MRASRRLRGLGATALLVLGCTACTGDGDAGTGRDSSSASTSTSTTTASSSSSASSSTTAAVDDAHDTTSAASTGVVFLLPNDGGISFECDVFRQDCPLGEKCTPWASDGGPTWNGTKCMPVVDDPAGSGEPCHVQGSPTSGLDDCDRRSMCFYVDPETLEGTCTPFCAGDEADPQCDRGRFCPLLADSALALCLPLCSPHQQDCPAGQACYPSMGEWVCSPDLSGDTGAYGDPCRSIMQCDPGLACVAASAVPWDACGDIACCTEICDLDDPAGDLQCMGAPEGVTCQPWYLDGEAPAGLEDLGACALPQ